MNTHGAPRSERMLRWFEYAHLPADKQTISKPFGELAGWVTINIKSGPERTACLRKLLEAKDCAVRAKIEETPE